jgi:hypothetical protein
MNVEGKKHKCPGCGLAFIAEVIGEGTDERLEISYDGNADEHAAAAESAIQQRIDAAVNAAVTDTRAEYESVVTEGPAERKTTDPFGGII